MGDAKKRSKPKKTSIGHQSGKLPKFKEEGYDYWTKTLQKRILKNYRTDSENVTDLVKLRTRRAKEVAKAKKDKK
tara:strand:- start:1396 stop:1620 length:225 start_codon:yes stop_codon:yes gene_type:complete